MFLKRPHGARHAQLKPADEKRRCDSRFVTRRVRRDFRGVSPGLTALAEPTVAETLGRDETTIKVTEPSGGAVMTAIDYLASADSKSLEMSCYADRNCG